MKSDSGALRRIDGLLSKEAETEKLGYWWISFADEKGFRGVIITEAVGFMTALQKTHRLGISPGGQVRGIPVPADADVKFFDKKHHDKVLSKEYISANDLA